MKPTSTRAFSILVELDPARDPEQEVGRRDGRSRGHQADELLQSVLATPRHEGATLLSLPGPVLPVRTDPRRRRALAVAAVAVLLLAGGLWWLSAGGGSHVHRTAASGPRVSSPAWRLASALSTAQFQQGSGNPTTVVGITCAGGVTCFLSTGYGLDYGGGGALYLSKDGGHAWSPTALPSTNDAVTTSVSCAGATWCAVGGGLLDPATGDPDKPMRDPVLLVTDDGGSTWTSEAVPFPTHVGEFTGTGQFPAETTYWPGQVDAVSCSAPGVCSVLGQSGLSGSGTQLLFAHTTNGGATWTSTRALPELPDEVSYQLPLQTTHGSPEGVACPTAQRCIVTATLLPPFGKSIVDVWRTTDGGSSWQESRLSGFVSIVPNVSCPTAEVCWAGPAYGNYGIPQLLHTTDGGATWSPLDVSAVPRPANLPDFLSYGGPGLSCTSGSVCYLTDEWGIDETLDAGSSWSLVPLPSSVSGVSQISCEPGGSCAAIAYSTPPAFNNFHGGSLVITDAPTGSG